MLGLILMRYKHNSRKAKRRYHLIHEESGKTYCKAENGSWRLDEIVSDLPHGARICGICKQLHREGKTPNGPSFREQRRDFYKSDEWAKLRYEVLKEAEHCLCCGATKQQARLTVDHVKPIWKYPELKLERSNLQVLCMLCNKGKGGRDETDFRLDTDPEEPNELDAEYAHIMRERLQ